MEKTFSKFQLMALEERLENDFFRYAFIQSCMFTSREQQNALIRDFVAMQRDGSSGEGLPFNTQLDISNIVDKFADKMTSILEAGGNKDG